MISAAGLYARAGTFAIESLSLEVTKGELLVLLGPSGAGKTLLLESLMGLVPLRAGQVVIDGRDVTQLPPERRNIAYMPQDVALFPHLSVRQNILFGRVVRRTQQDAEKDLVQLCEQLQIAHLVDRENIRTLSGGEKQRVGLARALITHPSVLFLDESFSALDAHVRKQLLHQLRQIQQTRGVTTVYVTHGQREASVIGDRVAVIMNGKILQVATPELLFRYPAHLDVARFIMLANIFKVDLCDERTCTVRGLKFKVARAPAVRGNVLRLGIAAEDVLVLRPVEGVELGLTHNIFSGRVTAIDMRQARSRLHIVLDANPELSVIAERVARDYLIPSRALSVGDAVEVYLAPEALSVFVEA